MVTNYHPQLQRKCIVLQLQHGQLHVYHVADAIVLRHRVVDAVSQRHLNAELYPVAVTVPQRHFYAELYYVADAVPQLHVITKLHPVSVAISLALVDLQLH